MDRANSAGDVQALSAPRKWLFLPGCLNYGIKCRLGFAVAIEQQRIVDAAADRKIVLPRIAIGDTPEGDARHNVGVLDEDGEEVCVALGKGLLNILGQAVDVGVGAGCGRGRNVRGVAAPGGREHVDIELADADLHSQGGEVTVAAFGADNSLGTWKLNMSKSKFDPGPGPVKSLTSMREAADGG